MGSLIRTSRLQRWIVAWKFTWGKMGGSMKEKTFYVNKEGYATLVCPTCGVAKNLDTSRLPPDKKNFRVKCTCGEVFKAHIEFRKQYRKAAQLPGHYVDRKRKDSGKIIVEDISMGGVGFRTLRGHDIAVNDMLELTFTLDTNPPRTITRLVKILRINGNKIGCVYAQQLDRDRDIGFYLMA